MYIGTTTSKGITYVKLFRSVWSKERKRSVTEVVQNFGRLDNLVKDNPNAFEELKARYKNQATAIAARRKTKREELAGKIIKLEETSKKDCQDLNFSVYPIGCIWKELGLDYKINQLKAETKIEFDVNRTLLHTVCMRIVDPQSHHYNWDCQNSWMGTMAKPLELHHFYRSLDFLEDNRDALMGWINQKLTEAGRDLSLVYYDTTNFYFETPWDDNEWEWARTARTFKMTFVEEAMLAGIVDGDALRMRGLSKERRNDMPLVAVALIVDKEGIPVDFRVYAGNKSEKTEMLESIKRLKLVYGIKRCVIAADRGLNTVENLVHIEDEGHQFMVAQSIAQLPEKTRKEICKPEGWIGNEKDSVRYKEIELTKTSQSENLERTYRLVVSLSASRLAHDKNAIELDWETANQAVNEGRKIYEKRPAWAKYVKFKIATDETEDEKDAKDSGGDNKKNGNKKNGSKKAKPKVAVDLDYEAYRKALAIAGMYAIVTDVPNRSAENPDGMTAKEVFSKQRQLLKIEDCFRVMKSALELRPVNVRNKKRIRGHVMLCVIALTIVRLLERKLREAGTPMSVNEISSYLEQATVRSGGAMGSMTFRPVHVPLIKDRSKNLRFAGDDNADAVDLIMKATGLIPIEYEYDRNGLARCLRTRFASDEEVLGLKKENDNCLPENNNEEAAPTAQAPVAEERKELKPRSPLKEISFTRKLPLELQQGLPTRSQRKLSFEPKRRSSAESQKRPTAEPPQNSLTGQQRNLPTGLEQKQSTEAEQKLPNELRKKSPNEPQQDLPTRSQQQLSLEPKRKSSAESQKRPTAEPPQNSLTGQQRNLPTGIEQKLSTEPQRKLPNEIQRNGLQRKASTEPEQKIPKEPRQDPPAKPQH